MNNLQQEEEPVADLNHSLDYSIDIWKERPQKICTKDLERSFEGAWRSPSTSEQELVRFQMLVSEMNNRSSKRYFWANFIISIVALTVAILSLKNGP